MKTIKSSLNQQGGRFATMIVFSSITKDFFNNLLILCRTNILIKAGVNYNGSFSIYAFFFYWSGDVVDSK
jgi:hypothetical protein